MKFLVTGGAGFIGSSVCRHILASGPHEVVNVDRLSYAANPLTVAELDAMASYTLERVDIADRHALAEVFERHRPDKVIHLAAESHVDRSIDAPAQFIDTNIVGTFHLLEAASHHFQSLNGASRDSFRFLHVSTDEVYGSLGESDRFSETSRYAPNSPYAASKAAADHLARAWRVTYGLPVVVTNCSNNYGPRQFPEKLIPLLILNGRAGKALPIYGDGLQVRDWLFVEDHARALVELALRAEPGSSFMIGGDCEKTNLEIVHAVCAELDRALPGSPHRPHARLITAVADRPGHDRRYAADASLIRSVIGWRPLVSLEEGLGRTVRWYLDHPEWCGACGEGARQRQGLRLEQAL